jgi:hypothetical protein
MGSRWRRHAWWRRSRRHPKGWWSRPMAAACWLSRVGRRLVRIELATGRLSTVADGLALGAQGIPGLVPTGSFNGVAVGPSAAVYVSGDKANVLYRLD